MYSPWGQNWNMPQNNFPVNQFSQNNAMLNNPNTFMNPSFSALQNNMQAQQQTPKVSGPDWIKVPNIQQIDQIVVEPGGNRWVMVQNQPVFSFLSADEMGLITKRYFKFFEFDPSKESSETTNSGDYATKQEVQELREMIENMNVSSKPAYNQKTSKKEVASE